MEEAGQLQTVLESDIAPGDFDSGGEVSSNLKDLLRKLGVPSQTVRQASIVAYELEMNTIIHSLGGEIKAEVSSELLRITAEDKGPGIENVEQALQPGYSTADKSVREMGFGAGMGLHNINNHSDKLEIESELEVGTKIESYIQFGD